MIKLFIVGLGRCDEAALARLEQGELSAVQTCIVHAAPEHLKEQLRAKGYRVVDIESFLAGEKDRSLGELTCRTAELILDELSEEAPSVYLLPGRPWSGDRAVSELRARAEAVGADVQIIPGEDLCSSVLEFMENEGGAVFPRGITFIDTLGLEELRDPPRGDIIVGPACSSALIPAVKRQLLKIYPPQHHINIYRFGREGLFMLGPRPLERIAVGEETHCWSFMHLTASPLYTLGDMAHMMERLRSPDGCPWDRKQDHRTLRPYVVEEAYEVVGAINRENGEELCEELGDLLLQIVFHSRLAEEKGVFSLWRVINGITTKIYRRHPHVFQREQACSAYEVSLKWQEIKRQEKGIKGRLSVSPDLPALMRAQKIQKRAADVGFDWPDIKGALEKMREEIVELYNAYSSGKKERIEEEIGDLFFALVNISRFLGVDSEMALGLTIDKFKRRFNHVEEQVMSRGGDFTRFCLEELDSWWEEAKNQEKKGK